MKEGKELFLAHLEMLVLNYLELNGTNKQKDTNCIADLRTLSWLLNWLTNSIGKSAAIMCI